MIKKITAILALGMSYNVAAQDAGNFAFDNIAISEIAKLGFVQVLNYNYIADDDFLNDKSTVTMHLKNQDTAELEKLLTSTIKSKGYTVNKQNKTVTIRKQDAAKNNNDLTPYFYKPKYRDVGYITDLVTPIFPQGSFTFQKKIQNNNQGEGAPVVDSGSSAYSLQNSNDKDAFIFQGSRADIEKLELLLEKIDTAQYQAQINAYLYEVSNNDKKESAFSLAVGILGKVLNLNLATQALANVITLKTGDISASLSALNSDTRFNVISSPMIFVKDGEKGKISVGADVPVLGQVSYSQNGQPIQSVEYKPSGVILEMQPKFHDTNLELTIHHQLSSFIPTQNGVNNSPTLIKREFNTVINANHDDIILIGGLSERRLSKSRSSTPIIPILATTKTYEKNGSEILLMLHVKKI